MGSLYKRGNVWWCKYYSNGRPIHPHMLRHSFASRLRENGAPLELVKEALRHREFSTTLMYAHISGPKKKADITPYLEGGA